MADLQIDFRSRISELGLQGKRLEGQILKKAGEVLAKGISNNIGRSNINSPGYVHLQDDIHVSRTKTNEFGERYVEVGASKKKSYILKFLEFGTSKMSAKLPMTKGVAQTKDDVRQILKEGAERIYRL